MMPLCQCFARRGNLYFCFLEKLASLHVRAITQGQGELP
jgi:hypothetical protein